jgi:cytochrome P450
VFDENVAPDSTSASAPLARLEGRIALGALHTRFPTMRLAVDPARLRWSHGDGLVLRGLSELPVHLGQQRRHPITD